MPQDTCEKSSTTSFSVNSFGRLVTYSLQFRISIDGGRAKLTLSFLRAIPNPFFPSIAAAASSSFANLTNPYPKLFRVTLSFTTLAVVISPYSSNRAYEEEKRWRGGGGG